MTALEPRIRVSIEYMKVSETKWTAVVLDANEYFESVEDESLMDLDCVPRHNHAVDYLDIEPREVRATRLTISSPLDGSSRIVNETSWNEGKCRVIERTDSGARPYWELIVESRIEDQPPLWDILRLVRRDALLVPIYHAVIRENADGSEEEVPIVPG